jgi:hypothetical protein
MVAHTVALGAAAVLLSTVLIPVRAVTAGTVLFASQYGTNYAIYRNT